MSARLKDIFREIRKSFGRFLSILLIVAAGVGFFVGVKATAPSMYQTAEQYFTKQNLMDIEVLSTVGFSDEDVEKVREIEHVKDVMPSYSADLLFKLGTETQVAKLLALPGENDDDLNMPKVLEGRLPEAEDECVLVEDGWISMMIPLGGDVTFEEYAGETEVDSVLQQRTFTVVGKVALPQYISYSFGSSSIGNGEVTAVLLAPQSNFLYPRYTELYLTLDSHENGIDAFQEDYDRVMDDVAVKLEDLGVIQFQALRKESESQIKDAEQEYNSGEAEAKRQLDEALAVLTDAKKQIDEGLAALQDGWKQYEAGSEEAKQQFADARKQLDDSWKAYEDGKKQLAAGEAEYNSMKASAEKELKDARAQLDDGWKQYNNGLKEYTDGMNKYIEGQAQYEQGLKEYMDGLEQYNAAVEQIAAAEAEYNEGLEQYNSSLSQYEESLSNYEQVESAFTQAQSSLAESGEISDTTVTDDQLASLQETITSLQQQVTEYETQLSTMDPESSDYATLQSEIELFNELIAHYQETLTELGSTHTVTQETVDSEVAYLQGKLDEAKAELDDAKAQLDAANEELVNGQAELEDANKQLEASKAELEAGKAELDAGQAELEAAAAELAAKGDIEGELNAAKAELDAGEAEYAAGLAELEAAAAEIANGKAELDDAKIQLDNAEKELKDKMAEAQIELDEAHQELIDSEKELEEAQEEYNDGMEEYSQAVEEVEKELSSGKNQIQSAKHALEDIVSGKWYVFSRDDVMESYANFKMDAQRVNAIADVFPVFFLLVAALVCLTTMSRMIDEQRIQLGTYKALGYKPREIVAKYLIYAALACIGGCIVGPIVCIAVLPRVIFGAYSSLYYLPALEISMPWKMLGISVVVALLCTVLVAFIACWKELHTTTAALMRPKSPKAGKKILLERIPVLWNRFGFFQKLTARNLFRYKVRLLMTVIGIAGCMALVVAGFGLEGAISPISKLHYEEISHDDLNIAFDQSYKYGDVKELYEKIRDDERLENTLLASQQDCKVYDKSEKKSLDEVFLFVPQDGEELQNLLTLRTPNNHSPLTLPDDGAVISEKISRRLGVGVGDEITVNAGENTYSVRVAGVSECYIYNYVYVSPAYYEQMTGQETRYNYVLASQSDKLTDSNAFCEELLQNEEDIIFVYFTSESQEMMNDTLGSMKLVVFVMILCAGILAFIVLYNLTNINLSERTREVATVKVLGFNQTETNMYIFRENIVLCLIGIVVGSVLGYLMAQYLISTVEVSMVTFARTIHPSTYLYSAGITLLFTVLVNLFMTKRIKEISMVESLKAIE